MEFCVENEQVYLLCLVTPKSHSCFSVWPHLDNIDLCQITADIFIYYVICSHSPSGLVILNIVDNIQLTTRGHYQQNTSVILAASGFSHGHCLFAIVCLPVNCKPSKKSSSQLLLCTSEKERRRNVQMLSSVSSL